MSRNVYVQLHIQLARLTSSRPVPCRLFSGSLTGRPSTAPDMLALHLYVSTYMSSVHVTIKSYLSSLSLTLLSLKLTYKVITSKI